MRMQKRMWGKAVTFCNEDLCYRLCGKYEEISPNSCLIQKLFVPVILEPLGSVQIVIFALKHNSVERAINCSCLPSKFRRRNFLLKLTAPWMRHFIFGWELTNPSRPLQFSSSPPEKHRDITAVHAGTRLDVSGATYQLHKHNSTLKQVAPFVTYFLPWWLQGQHLKSEEIHNISDKICIQR